MVGATFNITALSIPAVSSIKSSPNFRFNDSDTLTINSINTAIRGSSDSSVGVDGISNSGIGGYFSTTSGYGLIVAGGNVGIGTANPGNLLEVFRGEICVIESVFKINNSPGISASITTADLVGKTITVSGGLIIGYS